MNAARESARHEMVEIIAIADDLRHRNTLLREDGREIVEQVLSRLQEHCARATGADGDMSTACRQICLEARESIESSWVHTDELIDELLCAAADELLRFATGAEASIGRCERAITRGRTRELADNSET